MTSVLELDLDNPELYLHFKNELFRLRLSTVTALQTDSQRYSKSLPCNIHYPLSSDRQHLSYDVCPEVTGDYQNCSVLYCVLKLYAVISTLRWAVLTILWIGFCHTGSVSLCIDLFASICVYFVCFCFILHSCIIVSTVGWT